MKTIENAEILKNKLFAPNIWEMVIKTPKIVQEAKAGQFVNLYTGRGEYLLPRPISICEIQKEEGTLRLLYQIVGKGTEIFSQKKVGETIQVMGPLGNGFDLKQETCGAHVVIGGGIGAPPLLELVKGLQGKVYIFLGARSHPVLIEEFERLGAEVHVATEDGSFGFQGNVLELIHVVEPHADEIYACGPKVMLKNVAVWAAERGIVAQVSMEERMACGIGACVGCAVKIQKKDQSDWEHLKVCKDGPVFLSNEVIWDE